jgi:hypothetical protein
LNAARNLEKHDSKAQVHSFASVYEREIRITTGKLDNKSLYFKRLSQVSHFAWAMFGLLICSSIGVASLLIIAVRACKGRAAKESLQMVSQPLQVKGDSQAFEFVWKTNILLRNRPFQRSFFAYNELIKKRKLINSIEK